MTATAYCGRFAPSPTGPLHAGSVVAALASWLDAQAHHGRWLVRIEDIDPPRCQPGADHTILQQLAQLGLHPDAPPCWQSHPQAQARYARALQFLQTQGWAYPCACTRKTLQAHWQQQGWTAQRHQERPYPGICRQGLRGQPARSWRFHLERLVQHQLHMPQQADHAAYQLQADGLLRWQDRRQGAQAQYPAQVVGDCVLQRADGLWSYQLAVVVDDAAQGITHVVRGEDLSDNTPRQLLLQSALGLPHPRYLHTPLVRMADGEKLSKQHGAPAAQTEQPLPTLQAAAQVLGLPPAPENGPLGDILAFWVQAWHHIYIQCPP